MDNMIGWGHLKGEARTRSMSQTEIAELNAQVEREGMFLKDLTAELGKRMIGQTAMVDRVLVALLADDPISGAREVDDVVRYEAAYDAVARDPGEILAVCGPNGAGKSTLLAALAGDLRPASGEIRIDGAPAAKPPPRKAKPKAPDGTDQGDLF
mgnify:CR=1 FL=1